MARSMLAKVQIGGRGAKTAYQRTADFGEAWVDVDGNGCDTRDDVLRRDGVSTFAGIIVSTLPRTVSKWLKLDVPSRIARQTTVPVQHVIGHPAQVAV